jgi:hypothetical protein
MINEAKAVRVMKTRTAIRAKPGHFMPSLSSAKLLILILVSAVLWRIYDLGHPIIAIWMVGTFLSWLFLYGAGKSSEQSL